MSSKIMREIREHRKPTSVEKFLLTIANHANSATLEAR
jgi:hypothetical protein